MLEYKKRKIINADIIITSLCLIPFIILSLYNNITLLPFIIAYIMILLAICYKEKSISLSRYEDLAINGKEVNNLPFLVQIVDDERDIYQIIVNYNDKEYYSDLMYGVKYVSNKSSINLLYTKDNYVLSFDDFKIEKPIVDSSIKLNIRGILLLVILLFLISELADFLTDYMFDKLFLLIIPAALMMLVVLIIIKQTIRHKQKIRKINHLKIHGRLIRDVYCENKNWFSIVSGRYHEVKLHKVYCKISLPNGEKLKLISDTKDGFSFNNRCNVYPDFNNPKIYYIDDETC